MQPRLNGRVVLLPVHIQRLSFPFHSTSGPDCPPVCHDIRGLFYDGKGKFHLILIIKLPSCLGHGNLWILDPLGILGVFDNLRRVDS